MEASSVRAFTFYRCTDLYLRNSVIRPLRLPSLHRSSLSRSAVISCLNGGGVSDDYFVSTRRSRLDRGFTVISNLVNRIEPLDNSVISKGVSDSAKDSMKQTISSMLGLLPSNQFSVSVTVSKQPLHRLLISSIITGYTLWNAEYRVSLTRNLDISLGGEREGGESIKDCRGYESDKKAKEQRRLSDCSEGLNPRALGNLPPDALSYIQELQSELSTANEELDVQRKESVRIEHERDYRNDLLEYLRSLDPEMVTELSQPSSSEVEEIIHQLVHSVLQRFFKNETASENTAESAVGMRFEETEGDNDDTCGSLGASRDYLARLLFWCMLLGHHLRGLENRLHLSCAVGLL